MKLGEHFSNGVACFVAFCLFIFATCACVYQYRLEKKQASWPSVDGKITSWNESDVTVSSGSGPARRKVNQTYIDISYEFQICGVTYTGKSHFNSKASPRWIPLGKRHLTEYDNFPVQVFYNPLNPRQNVLQRATFTFEWYFWPFFILCPLYIFIYFHDIFSKSRSNVQCSSIPPSSSKISSSHLRSISSFPISSRFSRFFKWVHDNQFIVVALILFLTVALYCLATRYAAHPELAISIDRWTGRLIPLED